MVSISPQAGKPPLPSSLVDVPQLIDAYYSQFPDPKNQEQRVVFGTSGHRGTSLKRSFNEQHILAISQAICLYRQAHGIDGPLFLAKDTHALSEPAHTTALEVLLANGVEVMVAEKSPYTPTPAMSHAIICHNRGHSSHLSDGIGITPSHNPPQDGGFKYNPPHGGPADLSCTKWIEKTANELLENGLKNLKRTPIEKAIAMPTLHRHDFLTAYVNDLSSVIDMKIIADAKVSIGADPLGGASVHYWGPIAERYKLNLEVTNTQVDPTFRFMTCDWDGQIRMDPSSPYAIKGLLALKDRFDIACGADTDADRHGIVTKKAGLIPPNHFLSAALFYLLQHRPQWPQKCGAGKTLVTSQMVDRVAAFFKKKVYDMPVGFKWFVEGLASGTLAFAAEESAGATFVRLDGTVWTTDKDAIIPALLAAEMTAKMGKDPGELYSDLEKQFGTSFYERKDAPASKKQKEILKKLTAKQISVNLLAQEPIKEVLTHAPGNGESIGGIKVIAENGWFAARPSGTEEVYKIYGESFRSAAHLDLIFKDAQSIVEAAFKAET